MPKPTSKTTTPTVTTDLNDYAPGSTATVTASGFAAGSGVTFQVQHVSGAGPDGILGTLDDTVETTGGAGHDSWYVIDGGAGDLDGVVNGSVTTKWYVDPDDSLGATFLLTARSAGSDGILGTADDVVASASFTDADTITVTGVTTTLDESPGLQNSVATPTVPGDANDNDIAASALPSAFSTRLTANGVGTAINAALSGYTGAAANTGSNAFTISPAMGASISDVRFVDASGNALNGVDSGLKTTAGTSILLYSDASTTTSSSGRAGSSSGAVVFAAYIQETGTPVTGGKIWTVQYQTLRNPDATNPDDPVDLANKLYVGVSQNTQFSPRRRALGAEPVPDVHAEQSGDLRRRSGRHAHQRSDDHRHRQGPGQPVHRRQHHDRRHDQLQPGGRQHDLRHQQPDGDDRRGAALLVRDRRAPDVTIPNLDQNEADVEANIDFTAMFGARSATFQVVQLQSGKSAVVKVTAYNTADEPGVNFHRRLCE